MHNYDILNRCNTFSVQFQLQSKLGGLGLTFRMPNDRLPKKLSICKIKQLCPPGCPGCSFNVTALRDCQTVV